MEYGSSFRATLVEGALASINDSMMNLNTLHLSQRERTVFELVEDAGLVAGAINFFVFRGRVRHPLKRPRAVPMARRIGMFDAAYGPTRFFFGELFASDAHRRAAATSACTGATTSTPPRSGAGWWPATASTSSSTTCPRSTWRSTASGPDAALDAVERADAAVQRAGRGRGRPGAVPRALRGHPLRRPRAVAGARRRSSCAPRCPTCRSSSPRCARRRPTARSRSPRRTAPRWSTA